jgi:hypothetical protein
MEIPALKERAGYEIHGFPSVNVRADRREGAPALKKKTRVRTIRRNSSWRV